MAQRHFPKRIAAALSVALVLSLGLAAGTAWAYYTDTNKANGMVHFSYNPEPPKTEVKEEKDNLDKIITVENTGEVDAMVRVKVFAPAIDGVEVTENASDVSPFNPVEGNGWTQAVTNNGEKWLYYTEPVAPGDATAPLRVHVEVDAEKVTHPFDLTVVQQCASAKTFDPAKPFLGTFADGDKYKEAE